jgi:hypothetical protein
MQAMSAFVGVDDRQVHQVTCNAGFSVDLDH